jgi:alanine racemase
MTSNYRNTLAQVDLAALEHNFNKIKNYAPSAQIMAVIKADAYGHGILAIAHSLSAADAFAVACVDEGIILRNNNIHIPIIILEGFNSAQELTALVDNKLTPVINNLSQLKLLIDLVENILVEEEVNFWLKFDTGMHRLGFQIGQINNIQELIKQLPLKFKFYGLMSHFACADDIQSENLNYQQLEEFNQICEIFADKYQLKYSMANSAAIITLPDSHQQWVRPGIMLYGVNPILNETAKAIDLRTVMTLKSKLIAINYLHKGDCIGYGSDWCCPEDMPVGVVAIGYGDGYPRHAVSGTPVLLNGVKTQLIGRVSMDMITIDLRPLKDNNFPVKIGDEVILWGQDIAIEDVASYAGTIAYELLCGVSNRVVYEYIQTK